MKPTGRRMPGRRWESHRDEKQRSEQPQYTTTAATIKSRVKPATYFAARLGASLNPHGSSWQVAGLCPFHSDAQPGSFKVNVITGAAVCFSCGFRAGDVIAFEQALERCSFRDALVSLETFATARRHHDS
jgi:DNA primase